VTATAALRKYWRTRDFAEEVQAKGRIVKMAFTEIADSDERFSVRGRGMMQGLNVQDGELAGQITKAAFEKGLVIETSGSEGEVVKCLAPLTTSTEELREGLRILSECVHETLEAEKEAELAGVGQ